MAVDHLGGLLVRNVNDTGALFGQERDVGFGLGSRVVDDLGARGELGSAYEYRWGGAYHSSYWVDPKEELVVVYLAQLIPAANLDDHARFRALVYQAIDATNRAAAAVRGSRVTAPRIKTAPAEWAGPAPGPGSPAPSPRRTGLHGTSRTAIPVCDQTDLRVLVARARKPPGGLLCGRD